MDLGPRFFEQVRHVFRKFQRELQLYFIVAKDELTLILSINKHLICFVRELRSYGRSLVGFTIQGGASPEVAIISTRT